MYDGCAMPGHPTGTVTFLFTDVEGSTRLWEQHPDDMAVALERHDELLRRSIQACDGYVFSTAGDSFSAAFNRADDAASAAIKAQEAITAFAWPGAAQLRVRMGLHTGEAQERGGDYFGPSLNLCARLMSAANGGQIALSAATAELVRGRLPEQYQLRDVGEHRLKDLSQPLRLHILSGGTLPSARRPLRTVDGIPGNLASLLPAFIGREQELAALGEVMDAHRLVTVVGPAGAGKTRTSIQAAADAAASFPGGVWLIDLEPEEDGYDLSTTFARVLGVTSEAGGSAMDAATDALRFRPALLILDNCERVAAAVALLAERLLDACGELRIIATSREPLRARAERVFPLEPLSIDAAAGATSDAAELFIARALSEGVSGETLAAERPAIDELCARLDGLPLAIELAAARSRAIAPSQLLARMSDRFRVLTAGRRTSVARHETLQSAIDWSYSLLERQHKAVFERLSVFAGSFDVGDAAAVAGEPGADEVDMLDALSYLVERSFLVSVSGGSPTYRLLETLRAFGATQLEQAGETEHTRRRHALRFADKAAEARRSIVGSAHVATLDLLVAQTAEYRTAVERARTTGDIEMAARIAAGFCGASYFRIGFEALDWLVGSSAESSIEDGALLSELLGLLSRQAIFSGDIERGAELAERAVAADPGPPSVQARAQLAAAAAARNDPAMVDWAQSVVDVARAGDDDLGILLGDLMLGPILTGMGRTEEAIAVGQSLFDLADERRSEHARGWGHWVMGLAISRNDPEPARRHYEDAWRLGREEKNRYLESNALIALLEAHFALDAPPVAAAAARDTLSLLDETADNGYFTRILLSLIEMFLARHGHATAGLLDGYLGQFSLVLANARTRHRVRVAGEQLLAEDPAEFERQRTAGAHLTAEEAIRAALSALSELLE